MKGMATMIGAVAVVLLATGVATAQDEQRVVSGEDGRQSVNLTIYNNNLALVRETRRVELPRGRAVLEYANVAQQVRPETVYIRDTQAAGGITVLEQNYRYDVLTPSRLMELYVGEDLTLVRENPATGEETRTQANLLSTGSVPQVNYGYDPYGYGGGYYAGATYVDPGAAVYRTDEGITFGDVGRVVFPSVPDNFVSRPTLEWLLESTGGQKTIEATYLTYGMSWQSDYVLVLSEDEKKGDLAGWVTLRNDAGITLKNVRLQLVAGEVAVEPQYGGYGYGYGMYGYGAGGGGYGGAGFAEAGMFEYHLYTLERNTDVADHEQKQVQLLGVDGITMEKKYRLQGDSYYFVSEYGQPIENLQVAVWVEFENAQSQGLGVALPAGVIRVYKADSSGAQQFIGEDRINHTPREERVKLQLGNAFDIAAERKQTDYEILSSNLYETEWEIKIRNRKEGETIVVEVLEPMAGDWEIIEKSHDFVKESARLVRFDLTCPPDQEIVLTYRVRTRY
ncbi:MAG: DUF4139 domain-containing protein [Deltaproteobacteria bacterium]|nr:DUF4139 domain-containing protein [Deltaproteobacteria bacterium]